MELVPTQDDVVALLRRTGGLRDGHFEYPGGQHITEYLQVALTMRDYQAAKVLSVGLSRKVRANTEIRAMIPELSVVAPATGGLPVAYGVCEALRARQVYWAERENDSEPLHFRQYLEVQPGEESAAGGRYPAHRPESSPRSRSWWRSAAAKWSDWPWSCINPIRTAWTSVRCRSIIWRSSTAKYYANAAACELCKRGVPFDKVRL